MQRRKFLIGSAGAVATAAFGSLAYTEATVNRSANVSVVTDDDANAALLFDAQLGTSINADGQLVVDGLSNLNGGGDAYATPDGTFVFGDSASPSTTYAFSMTNQLASSRAFDVAINNLAPSGADLVMTFYDGTGSQIGQADSATDATGMTLSAGSAAYCVLEVVTDVDTTAITGDIVISAA
ncbi:hypothetical protein [Halorubrum lacusprofundi]|jgi:hypothetical protein|uniref:hypothetical protein n=1 Tax=Halorubrum lacusprofundi TaxID=2247 RepID=UPI0012ABEE6E|nr:hypothetical protein [Halorubrum lacusprofundi]